MSQGLKQYTFYIKYSLGGAFMAYNETITTSYEDIAWDVIRRRHSDKFEKTIELVDTFDWENNDRFYFP